jgi:AraC-like DNA-binding protein
MIQTVFRSEDLPAEDRMPSLDELWVSSVHPMRAVDRTPGGIRATVRALDLAAVNVAELTLSPCEVLRTPGLIRRADPELLSAIVVLGGSLIVSQADREETLNPRELALYDSSQPFRLRVAPNGGTATLVRAHIPRAHLGLAVRSLRPLLARSLPGRTGFGGLLAQLLADVTEGSAAYRPSDLHRLGTIAQDLLTATVAHHLDAESAAPDESRQRRLLLGIEGFVQQHLHDPSLSPETVAAAHHISVRYLHRLFRTREATLAAWIRHQRLEHAHRDLTDPALSRVPIHQIAARWGFRDHPTFARAFRSAYGAPPRHFRCEPAAHPVPP